MNRHDRNADGNQVDRESADRQSKILSPDEIRQQQLQRLDGFPDKNESIDDAGEWTEVVARLGELDRAIGVKLASVPVPDDLADRLRRQARRNLGREDSKSSPIAEPVRPNSIDDRSIGRDGPVRRNRQLTVRRLTITCAALLILVVTSLGVGMLLWPQANPPVSRQSISHDVMKWVRVLDHAQWKSDPDRMIADYPIGPDILPSPKRWMEFPTDYDPQTIVYDLTPAGTKRVLQFTVRCSREFDLASFLPLTPMYQTGQFCIGGCYRDGLLYVLFVEGNAHRYRQMIEKRLGPV